MTKLAIAIYLWLAQQPVSKYDVHEDPEFRQERLSTIAQAVVDASDGDRGKISFLLIQAKHESGFRLDVQECRCPEGQCDNGRAHSPWQLHRVPALPIEDWHGYCGTSLEAVTSAARRTLWAYDQRSLACSYARLGGARASCSDSWAKQRSSEARRLAGAL